MPEWLYLDAVVVSLLAIMTAASISIGTVIHWWIPHEAMLQRLISLLVPLKMPDHFFLLDEDPWITVQAVEVFPVTIQLISVQRDVEEDYWISQTKISDNKCYEKSWDNIRMYCLLFLLVMSQDRMDYGLEVKDCWFLIKEWIFLIATILRSVLGLIKPLIQWAPGLFFDIKVNRVW